MTIQIQIRREFRCTDVFRGWGSVEVSHLPAGKEEDGLEKAHCGQASLHCSCQLLLVRQTVQELWQSSTSQHKVWRWLSVTSSLFLVIHYHCEYRHQKPQNAIIWRPCASNNNAHNQRREWKGAKIFAKFMSLVLCVFIRCARTLNDCILWCWCLYSQW